MIDPKNITFDKHNKPSLTADAKCTIIETLIKDHASMNCPACPMTEDERSIVLRFGTEIVQRTLDTINRVLDGDVALLNESGTFTDFAEVAAFYVKRADNSLAIARRVSAPNADGLCITGSHLTII